MKVIQLQGQQKPKYEIVVICGDPGKPIAGPWTRDTSTHCVVKNGELYDLYRMQDTVVDALNLLHAVREAASGDSRGEQRIAKVDA